MTNVKSFLLPFLVVLCQLCWMILFPFFTPGSTIQYPFFVYGAIPTIGTAVLLCWFLTRPPRTPRYRLAVLSVFAFTAVSQAVLLHPSLRLTRVFVFQPFISSALVFAMFIVRNQTPMVQLRSAITVVVVLVCLTCSIGMQGMNGVLVPQFAWRWRVANEQRPAPLAGRGGVISVHVPAIPGEYDWPAFRGQGRDNVVRNGQLDTDWNERPPQELWRTAMGPGWSSFSVVGDCAFTQEQNGPNEVISCRRVTSGAILWSKAIKGRFEDSSSGPGPRSTPAYADGKLYALTATGVIAGLDATDGSVLWQNDLKKLFDVAVPHWGFASSPLVIEDQVVVFTGAGRGNSVAAFAAESGTVCWRNGHGTHGYSSPHCVRFHEQPQILLASNRGVEAMDPDSGTMLWSHSWDIGFSPRIVQPCRLSEDTLLLATAYGKGTRRLQVEFERGQWSAHSVWTSSKFKPYFNDFVYHEGFVYGFDGNMLSCLDVDSGQRRWRRRGFGNGQLLLLRPQQKLLVISEKGIVSLIEADEDGCQIVADFQALAGKTWNHPVISGSYLLVRNDTEAVCYELPTKKSTSPNNGSFDE